VVCRFEFGSLIEQKPSSDRALPSTVRTRSRPEQSLETGRPLAGPAAVPSWRRRRTVRGSHHRGRTRPEPGRQNYGSQQFLADHRAVLDPKVAFSASVLLLSDLAPLQVDRIEISVTSTPPIDRGQLLLRVLYNTPVDLCKTPSISGRALRAKRKTRRSHEAKRFFGDPSLAPGNNTNCSHGSVRERSNEPRSARVLNPLNIA
jgi:hypothetical protein